MMYFELSNKENLARLKVDDCKKCGHPTLQMELSTPKHQCLNCGTIWSLDYVYVEVK